MITGTHLIRFAPLAETDVVQWREVPHDWPVLSGSVHLWRLALEGASAIQVTTLVETLGSEEREQAGQFHFDAHRRRFVIGRGLIRAILGRYLDVAPAALRYRYGQWGKPHLADRAGLHFNYSNTGDLGLLAVRRAGPVGVDVELADRREWTVREAVLKATGLGISGLNREIDDCTVQTFVPAPGCIASIARLDPARQSEFPAS